jgi:hypothetical protein
MYRKLWFIPLVVLAATAFALTAVAQDKNFNGSVAFEKAKAAVASGSPTDALGLLELAMTQSAVGNPRVFGESQGQYWSLLEKTHDYPRTYAFFNNLAVSLPDNANVLAAKGGAIGGYIEWLHMGNTGTLVSSQWIQKLDAEARAAYDRALKLDPENFSALLGLAIYESYTPGGTERSHAVFERLNGLRAKHAEYPWAIVDQYASARREAVKN